MDSGTTIVESTRSVDELISDAERFGQAYAVHCSAACDAGRVYVVDDGNTRNIIVSPYNDYAVKFLYTWDDIVQKEKALAFHHLRITVQRVRIELGLPLASLY